MEIPDTLWSSLRLVGGFGLFVLGISFAWKFYNAAFLGKVVYWSGLEKFGFAFMPITVFLSPMICHLPYDKKNSLIHTRQELWVHLVFGPVFFVSALMCMTSGSDAMGIPGSTSLNTVLTVGRHDVPACIVYTPPGTTQFIGSYKFPFVRKATKTILKALTIKVPEDKKNSYNAYEQGGTDLDQYSKVTGSEWFEDDEPVAVVRPASNTTPAPRRKK